MLSNPRSSPTDQDEEHALLAEIEDRGAPAESGQGYCSSRWLLVFGVFLALGAMWTAGRSLGAWPAQEPAEVAQQAVERKAAPKEGKSADARKDAMSTGSEGMAAVISSSVALAVSDNGALETAENRKKIGDMLTGCGSTCLAVTGVATVESAGAAVPAVAACVPLVVAGGAISAFNDNALSTDELAHMMNANFDKLCEQINQGFVSLADKLEGLVQDINKDQASKQFATVSTINEFYRHMWVHIHQDALTDKSLPTEIGIVVEFGAQLLLTALREYLENVLRSGAMILDILRAAVGFVAWNC